MRFVACLIKHEAPAPANYFNAFRPIAGEQWKCRRLLFIAGEQATYQPGDAFRHRRAKCLLRAFQRVLWRENLEIWRRKKGRWHR